MGKMPAGLAAWQAARKAGGAKPTVKKMTSVKNTSTKPKTVVKKKK